MLSKVLLIVTAPGIPSSDPPAAWLAGLTRCIVAATLHACETRIRLNGTVSTTRVQTRDAARAKRLVRAQYGETVTVLSVKRADHRRNRPRVAR